MSHPIVITGSLDCEYKLLVQMMEVRSEYKFGNYTFYEGLLNGKEVVVVNTLCGMVNAASAVTAAIIKLDPCCVISQGTAGAHNKNLNQYDIILGRRLVEISTCFYKHADFGAGINIENASFIGEQIEEDGKIVWRNSLESDERLIALAKDTPYSKGRVIDGTVGSGDAWNRELDRISFLHEMFGTDCEEMEGFAIAQVCRQHNVPFLSVRIISNTEWNSGLTFDEKSGLTCQEYIAEIVKNIVPDMD